MEHEDKVPERQADTEPRGSPASEKDRFDSWKEIATYLDRSVSTVYRWEREEEFPVHRHVHDERATVYAYRSEIEAWLADRRPEFGKNGLRTQAAPFWQDKKTLGFVASRTPPASRSRMPSLAPGQRQLRRRLSRTSPRLRPKPWTTRTASRLRTPRFSAWRTGLELARCRLTPPADR